MAFFKKKKINKNFILGIGFWYHWLSLEWCSFALLNILSRVYAYMCIVNYEHWGFFFFKYFLTLCKVKWQNAWVSLEFIIIIFLIWWFWFDGSCGFDKAKSVWYAVRSIQTVDLHGRSQILEILNDDVFFLFFHIESVALWIHDKLWSFSP